VSEDTYRAALVRAAELLGGAKSLCDRLHVPMSDLTHWLAGNGKPPVGIFLRVIDILIEEGRKPKFFPYRPTEDPDKKDGI
jgi:hypothetical protein